MKFTLDRFEGTKAVLIYNSQQLVVDCSELPEGVKEGDVLKVSFIIDLKATRLARHNVSSLVRKIFKE